MGSQRVRHDWSTHAQTSFIYSYTDILIVLFMIIYELSRVLRSLNGHVRYGIISSSWGRKSIHMTWRHILQRPGGSKSLSSCCTVFMEHTGEWSPLTRANSARLPTPRIPGQADTCPLMQKKNTNIAFAPLLPKRYQLALNREETPRQGPETWETQAKKFQGNTH